MLASNSAIIYGNGQNTNIIYPCTIPLGIVAFGLSFAATFGTVERTTFGTFDQISDAGLAVVVKTRQDFGVLEMLRAYWAREFVVQFLEARGEQISTTLSHLAPLGDRSRMLTCVHAPPVLIGPFSARNCVKLSYKTVSVH